MFQLPPNTDTFGIKEHHIKNLLWPQNIKLFAKISFGKGEEPKYSKIHSKDHGGDFCGRTFALTYIFNVIDCLLHDILLLGFFNKISYG